MSRQIVVEITGDSKGFGRATEEASNHAKGLLDTIKGVAGGMAVFNVAQEVIAGVVDQVKASGDIFRADQTSIAEMGNTLDNTVPGWRAYSKGVEGFVTQMGALGFKAEDVRSSIAQLSGVTHNLGEAQQDSYLAMDLARAKGLDLATATDIVTKAHEGNFKALKGLGIEVGKQATGAQALKAIYNNVQGAASTWADTSQGKLAAAQETNRASWVKIGAIVDRIQSALLPPLAAAFSRVADAVGPLSDWVMNHLWPALQQVGSIIAKTLVPIIETQFVPQIKQIWAQLQPLLPTLKLIAEIIGFVVVAAIVVVVVAIGLWIKQMLTMWQVLTAVADWIVQRFVPGVGGAFNAIGTFVHNAIAGAQNDWERMISFLKGLPGRVTSAASGMWNGIWSAFKGMLNMIVGAWNSLHFSTPKVDFLGQHIPSATFSVPQIPYFEHGGMMPYTGIAYLHKGETVTPAGRGGGDVHIHVENWYGSQGADLDRFANLILQRIRFAPGT